jgi:hypothetical protein
MFGCLVVCFALPIKRINDANHKIYRYHYQLNQYEQEMKKMLMLMIDF